MADLAAELRRWRGRRVTVLGVGGDGRGDDAFGPALAAALQARVAPDGPLRAVDAGPCPERWVGAVANAGCQELVFADAVELGAAPGAAALLGADELRARPPAAAAHRVPLSALALYAEGLGARPWLLGVQPGRLGAGQALSPAVAGAVEALAALLCRALGAGRAGGRGA